MTNIYMPNDTLEE